MSKERIKGFNAPLDLQYKNPNGSTNIRGNNLAKWRESVNPVAAAVHQFQITLPVKQNFAIVKLQFTVICITNANLSKVMDNVVCSAFSGNTDLQVSYPADTYQSNYGILTVTGNPQNKDLVIDCGDGVIFPTGGNLVFDITAYYAAGFAVTDTLIATVNMLWR